MYQLTELEKWEKAQQEKELKRVFGEKTSESLMKNPRNEKLRKCEKFGQHFDKEMTKVRRKMQRKFKRKMKERLYNEAYYRPINKDYKTYGWITW